MTNKRSTLTPADVYVRVTNQHMFVIAWVRYVGTFRMAFPAYMPEDEAVGTFLRHANQARQEACEHDRTTYYYGPQSEECDDCGKRL